MMLHVVIIIYKYILKGPRRSADCDLHVCGCMARARPARPRNAKSGAEEGFGFSLTKTLIYIWRELNERLTMRLPPGARLGEACEELGCCSPPSPTAVLSTIILPNQAPTHKALMQATTKIVKRGTDVSHDVFRNNIFSEINDSLGKSLLLSALPSVEAVDARHEWKASK